MSDTPETDQVKAKLHTNWNDLLNHARKLERERDEAREKNAKLRDIANRAISYLDQSYRDGFADEASDLRYEIKQLKEDAK